MSYILNVIIWTAAITIIGGGIGYFLYIKTRPRKITWKAKVYQLAEGVKPPVLDKKGNIVSEIKLCELKPFCKDTIERVDKKPGITIYRLMGLNKTTPAITADVVENWGENKEVSVLYHGEACTLLKIGYDKETNNKIFTPLSYDDVTMIKNEMAVRKDRLQDKKDILSAITPWVVAGICILGLIGISYLVIEGFISISEDLSEASKYQADQQVKAAEITREGMLALAGEIHNIKDENGLGKQNINKQSVPMIE